MIKVNLDHKNSAEYNKIFELIQKNEFELAFLLSKKIMERDFENLNNNENTLRFYNNFLALCFKLEKYNEGASWSDKLQYAGRKNPYIFHHTACLYVKTEQLAKAMEQVKLACKYRYQEIENMLNDKDLEPLFKIKEFQELKNEPIITKEKLKKIIFEAFKDVPKGEGLGARECVAEDDWASEEESRKARSLDIEKYWWEYPKEFVKSGDLKYSLNYNNKDGVKFHLPALMWADIDGPTDPYGFAETGGISIFFTLCLENFGTRPHHGHKEYLDYMKSIDIFKIIKYYDFTPAQIHAIGLYFLFVDDTYKQTQQEELESINYVHEQSIKYGGGKKNYNLTLEDAIAIKDQEKRIFSDWFKAGGVNRDDLIINNK